MAKSFSVFVDIGGRLNKSLPAAVAAAESALGRLGKRLSLVNAAAAGSLNRAAAGLTAAARHADQAGRAVSAKISAPMGLLATGAGRMAFEFEKAGNMLEALGDATSDQRKDFEDLANTLNKKYPQSLTGIINTGNEMLKGGFNFDQMKGALDQTLATAVLGEMSPAEVGNMMARTINSFQLPMKTYQEAMRSSQRVSDQMTFAAVKTTASLKDMGEMYRYVGGASSAAGISLEQATAFAMAFAKNGSVGSDAGVALRSAIVRLVKMPPKALGAMERVGMKLGDYVGGGRQLTAGNIISGLQADGIDASPVRKQIERALSDKALKGSPVKLSAAITKIVQSAMTNAGSALDASTIAQSVQESIVAAGSKVDLVKFFGDLGKKLAAGTATLGDVATILEGRHASRYMAVLQSNLPDLIRQVQTESDGYAQARYGIVLKGIVGPVYELSAAIEKLSVSLGRAVFPTLAKGISAVSDAVDGLSDSNPKLMKFAGAAGIASIALGPFLIAGGATVRALSLLTRGLGALGLAATVGLATRLTAAAGAIRALASATALVAIGRLRGLAAGLLMLSLFGRRAVVGAALLTGLRALPVALLATLAPVRLFAAALGLLRVALIGTGVGAALVAIGAAGAFIYRNWSGLQKAFITFKAGFMAALGPDAQGALKPVLSLVASVTQAFDDLTRKRPDGTLMMWGYSLGRSLGQAAASLRQLQPLFDGVATAWGKFKGWVDSGSGDLFANTKREFEWWWNLGTKITESATEFGAGVKKLAQKGYDTVANFDWAAAGKAIIDGIVTGIGSATNALVEALKGAVSSAWQSALSSIGLGTRVPAAPSAGALPARARGGSVLSGKTYLVGEHGPELFRAAGSGRIETNRTLNNLAERMNGPKPEPGGGGKSWYDAVMRAEGTSGRDPYNTVLGYGRYGSPEKPLTDMSLSEAYQFGRSVRARHGSSSALGAFQIVGRTMKDAMKATGLGWDDKFSPENQRTMADWIRRKQGFGAWEGFKRHPGELAAARAGGSVVDPTEGPASRSSSAAVGKIIRDAQEGAARHAAGQGGGGEDHYSDLASRAASTIGRAQAAVKAEATRTKSSHKSGGGINVSINITTSGGDPNEIARVVDQRLRLTLAQFEAEQRRALSD